MKAVILAAGFGTRLYPLTRNRPKALLEIGGKTLMDHLLEKINIFPKIREIIVVTNGRFYVDFFKWKRESAYRKKIQIIDDNVFEPEKRCGAVRDLYLAIQADPDSFQDYLVLCSDNFFSFPIPHFLLSCLSHPRCAFVGVYDLKDPVAASKFGVMQLDSHHKIIDFEEKPEKPKSTLVSIGAYYFPSTVRSRLYEYLEIERLNPDRIGDFIAWLAKKEPLYGVEFDGQWFDIGSIQSYDEARRALAACPAVEE